MPLFSEALRDSKLFSLPPSSVARRIKSSNVPKHQVLVTPAASAHRQDWGLKFPVAGAKSKQVEFQQFEDRFSTNGVSNFPKFTSKVANLDFLGAAVTLPSSRRLRSLYDAPAAVDEQASLSNRRRGLKHLSDREFRNVMQKARNLPSNETLKGLGLGGEINHFPANNQSNFIPERAKYEPVQWQVSGIGSTYGTPGVLHNLPNGVFEQRRVKGRTMPGRAHKGAVAFGGFVATNHGGAAAQVPWYETQNLSICSTISSDTDANLQITVQSDSPNRDFHLLDSLTNV